MFNLNTKIQPRNFDFSESEKTVFQFLREVTQHYCPEAVLRVAGGWVRDKYLGKEEAKDIDIALNMMGVTYAEYVNSYYKLKGEKTHTIGVIKANPELNKHLEVASMKVKGVMVDFVNLRCTNFTDENKNAVAIGTPEEDALHRDLTINSLFYNINTDVIEDWSEKGVKDLNYRLIRTPLPANKTFKDDPLRIIRAIRFAAKLGFDIVPEISEACTDQVKQAISKSISRERVGKEIMSILSTSRALYGLRLLSDFDLTLHVFQFPEKVEPTPKECAMCVVYSIRLEKFLTLFKLQIEEDEFKILALSAFLLPFSEYTYKEKSRTFPVVNYILMNSLKITRKDCDTASTILNTFKKWNGIVANFSNGLNRKEVGLIMRETGPLWQSSLICSLLNSMDSVETSIIEKEIGKIVKKWLKIREEIINLGLIGVWELQHFFDGDEIIKLLNLTTGGKFIKTVKDEQMCWQLENPQGTPKECQDWICSKFKNN